MPNVGYDTWYKKQCNTVFRVKNIAKNNKRIHLFKYPIKNGEVRDLMDIPCVSEADIRHSLLKGELFIKAIAKEIVVVESTIDLLQFDPCHEDFLKSLGIVIGTSVSGGGGGGGGDGYVSVHQNIPLLGPKNNSNRTFMVPPGDKFYQGDLFDNHYEIIVEHNGRRLELDTDYIVLESGGYGTGYDTIEFVSFIPSPKSVIVADYVIKK